MNDQTKHDGQQRLPNPVAWVRFCSDGGIEGPILDSDSRMDGVRRTSGAWTPLYTAKPEPVNQRLLEVVENILAPDMISLLPQEYVAKVKAVIDDAKEIKEAGIPVTFYGIDPLNPIKTESATQPMIPDSWRFGFIRSNSGIAFCAQDNGPFVAWDAVKDKLAIDQQLLAVLKGATRLLRAAGYTMEGTITTPMLAAITSAEAAQPVGEQMPEFENHAMQTVYEILCDGANPPVGEHWEGWQARKIVQALSAQQPASAQPVAVPDVCLPEGWREFIADVAQQNPEKPDYWSSCGQCARNIDRAEDLLSAAQKGGAA